MKLLLLAFGGDAYGASVEDEGAVDGAALLMVSLVFFMVGIFAAWFWQMARRARKLNPTDELIEELAEEKRATERVTPVAGDDELEPWEKQGDWWKDED